MSTTDDLLRNAEQYAASFDKGELPLPPAKGVAVVACMDARLIPTRVLGLEEGDAHVIRLNSSSVKVSIPQSVWWMRMISFTDDEFKRSVQDDTGIKPEWAAEAFSDLDEDVRQSIARIQASPFIPHKDSIRGFVYEVETGRLREVDAGPAQSRFRREPADDRVTS